MRGSLGLGLVIGAAVGAGVTYVALRPPWASHGTPAQDAGVVAQAPSDGGPKKPVKKHVRRRPGGGTTSGDEQGWGGGDTVEETEPQLVQLSAADRVLEWRGDDTSRPPQKLDMSNGAESRSLDDSEINSVITSQSDGVQQCVIQAATNTDLRGTITVKLVVDGTGHVIKSKLQAPHYLFEHGLLPCAQRALARMKFPSTGSSTLVTMPVNFS